MNKRKQKILTISAIAFAVIMAAGLVLIILSLKGLTNSGSAEISPLILPIVLTIAGAVGVTVMVGLSIADLVKLKNSDGIFEISNKLYSIEPSILKDERIQKIPEVQRLMQYESVRRALSDGELPKNDPHICELVEVLSNLADENGVIRL